MTEREKREIDAAAHWTRLAWFAAILTVVGVVVELI